MTATITALYAALDQPDANVPMILGQLADAYDDAGDEVRGRVIRWAWWHGREPAEEEDGWTWYCGFWGYHDRTSFIPQRAHLHMRKANVPWLMYASRSDAYRALADDFAEWVERRWGAS